MLDLNVDINQNIKDATFYKQWFFPLFRTD